MSRKKEIKEVSAAAAWLKEVAIDHLNDRGFTTLQCHREVFGVGVGIEVFYDETGGDVALCVVSQIGVWQATERFNVESPEKAKAEEWAGGATCAFTVIALTMLHANLFQVKSDQLAIEAAASVAASGKGAKRL